MNHAPCVIWRFTDGKAGHEAQSRGLAQALARLRPVVRHDLPAPKIRPGLRQHWAALPDPDLIIGAGHAAHLPMLAARWARGGRVIVLMKPSLPLRCFDLSIIPEHDGIAPSQRVLLSIGALNTVVPAEQLDPARGLILIGGPSKHYGWDDAAMLAQIHRVVEQSGACQWYLTTSRRTPASLLSALMATSLDNLDVIPHTQTPAGWVAEQLSRARQVWVSEDSISMIFEALTAGAGVGLLRAPPKRDSKISRYTRQLIAQNWVTAYADWQPGSLLRLPPQPLNEAERCARWIDQRFLAAS